MPPMTIPQLAREMGVSRVTVYNKVKSGQIPATKVGPNYVISARTARRVLQMELTVADKRRINDAVDRIVAQYGELLKWLGAE